MITPEKPAHSALRGKCAPIVPPLLRPTFPRPREAERTLRQNRGKSRLRHLPVWGSHLFGPPGGLFGSLWSHSERKHNWVLAVHNGPYFQRHLLSLLRSQNRTISDRGILRSLRNDSRESVAIPAVFHLVDFMHSLSTVVSFGLLSDRFRGQFHLSGMSKFPRFRPLDPSL